jgi:hypothetical protein
MLVKVEEPRGPPRSLIPLEAVVTGQERIPVLVESSRIVFVILRL